MNNILQFTTSKNNKKIDVYNNINLDVALSFNNLTYTLLHENNNNIINNSILFNLEDTDTMYNIFLNNSYQYSYQLNNILFIDNEKNMHILNYNLYSKDNFIIEDNNIKLNILDNKYNQNIYSYNFDNSSYIYSNDKNLSKLSILNKGLYKFNNDFKINNDKVSLNINKYNYNNNDIDNLINNYSYILNYYNDNIKLFPKTNKFKKIYYYNNLNIVPNNNIIYNDYPIYFNDTHGNKVIKLNIDNSQIDNSLFNINKTLYKIPIIKDNYFIIDIPIIYEYETYVNEEFNFMDELYNIDINKFNIKTNLSSIGILNSNYYIKLNINNSYIYDYKPIDIDINNSNKIYNFNKVRILLRVCLYFDVNPNIYEIIYRNCCSYDNDKFIVKQNYQNSILTNLFTITIEYLNNINYNISLFIDCSGNMFKKLYHNYNYGFNFNGYGDCIGLLLFPHKNYQYINLNNYKLLNPNIKFDNSIDKEYTNNISFYMNKKDIFINFSEKSLNNILVKNNIYTSLTNYNLPNFNKVITHSISLSNNNNDNNTQKRLNIDHYKISLIDDVKQCSFIYKTNKLNSDINYLYYPSDITYYDNLNNINGINLDNYVFVDMNKYDNYNYQYHPYVFCEEPIIHNYELVSIQPDTYEFIPYIPSENCTYMCMNTSLPDDSYYTNNMYIISDNITFTNSKDFTFGKLQIVNLINYNNAINNPYFMDHNIHNNIFKDIYNYRKSGLQFGDFYTPSIQNYLMLYKFNIINFLEEDLYNNYNKSSYYLSSCQFYKNLNISNYPKQYSFNSKFNLEYGIDNYENATYIWPFFSIPDYSVINSDNYFVIFDEIDNCDYIDYYINSDQKNIYLNIRNYKYNIKTLNLISSDNKFKIDNDNIIYSDIDNNILNVKITINNIRLLKENNLIIIYYKDTEDYLNNYQINNNKYRILCKILLKIEDN